MNNPTKLNLQIRLDNTIKVSHGKKDSHGYNG